MIPTSTDITISLKTSAPANAEAVVTFSTEGSAGAELAGPVGDDEKAAILRLASGGAALGKAKEVVFDVLKTPAGKFHRVFSIGLGKPDKITGESLRQAGGRLLRTLRKHKLTRAAIVLPIIGSIAAADLLEALVGGILLAGFEYREYKGAGQKKDGDPPAGKLERTLISETPAELRTALDSARAIADGQNFARTIASRPGNNINPPSLAAVASQMAKEVGLGCKILDEKQMAKLGMGGILAVGAGSISTPPRMIVLEYGAGRGDAGTRGRGEKKTSPKGAGPLLVVGKSITFDAGGVSIKPAEKMGNMIYDKCGGMAVLGFMYALAKLKLPIHVVGILSSAENILSSKAYRPGDILTMYNGVTVDVTNTDAEGRLVLGDALAWGIETYKPTAVVDLATLTGGVVVALGKTMAGVMSNNDGLVQELSEAAEAVGEKIWRLPLGEDQRDYIRGHHADILNSAGREGHPLQGGAFLSFFIPDDGSVPWAHLDIAGVADTEKEMPYYDKGATGWGVRTLVKWAAGRAE